MTGENEVWEAVLAGVEADMLRSRDIVADNDGGRLDATSPIRVGPMSLGAPAPELPPLEQMPPVPEALRERILQLRTNIIELQIELAAQMDKWRDRHGELRRAPAVSSFVVAPQAHFVDRRM